MRVKCSGALVKVKVKVKAQLSRHEGRNSSSASVFVLAAAAFACHDNGFGWTIYCPRNNCDKHYY